ncbi:helix-turn-helix domain-containing protein [Phaeobacter sp. JH20_02]|uniref:helix-turn-helix domain-containing protein n=1 Tax=Phaeobacter sp. JH20_02 TaxID=3112461 RepID=UPI003A8B05BA
MTKSAFYQRLEARMKSEGMSIAQLSRVSGVPYHQIHTWGRRENAVPNAGALEKVAAALKVPSAHLLNGDNFEESHSGLLSEVQDLLTHLSQEELRVLKAAAEAMRAGGHQEDL